MTLSEIMSLFGSLGIGVTVGALIVFFLLKSYLPSYLSEKGKNLATKEDVALITDKVESIKTTYAKALEELRSNNQLKLAEIEREKNIKKEVYLQAVEALTRSQNVVVTLFNLNIDDQKVTSGMVDDSGLIAKVQIVGSERTVKAVTTIMASIGTSIMELMLERRILLERKGTIDLLDGFQSKAQSEIGRYISMMKELNLAGNQDERLWNVINNNIQFETQQRDKYEKEANDLRDIQTKEHLQFIKKCMSKFFEISQLLPDAVLSVRKELGLKISSEAYLDIFNKNTEQGKKVFADFFEKILAK